MSNQETLKTYDEHFDRYIDGSPQIVNADRSQGKWLLEAMSYLPKEARILEIGSAFGRDAKFLQEQGYAPQLTDAFDAAVAYLNTHGFEATKLNILTDEPDDEYDAIIASAVFLHFTEVELRDVLVKCRQHLGQSGILAFTLAIGNGEGWSDRKMGAPRYFHYWQASEVSELLKDADFSVLSERVSDDDTPGWLHYIARINDGN